MSTQTDRKPSLLRGTSIVSGLTILSRIFGFVRDLLVAKLFGAGMFADAFFVAFRIPNLLRSFVAEGALTSAFVPVFSSSLHKGKENAAETIRKVISFLLIVTGLLTVAGVYYSSTIVSLFAPGFVESSEKFTLCIILTQIMMPYIICISLIAMLNAALNTVHIYGVAALSQVIMNLVLIAGALVAMAFTDNTACYILAASVVVGGIVQVIAQIPTAHKAGFKLLPSASFWSPEIKDLVKLMLPALVGASIYQITIFIATLLASLLEEGSVSWLFYADRLAQFPIGVYSVALASVLLPALSHAHARDEGSVFELRLMDSLRFTSFLLIPLSVFMFIFAEPIVRLVFERGAFDPYSTTRTALALQGLVLGIWWVSCHSMLVRAFIAKKDTLTPTLIGVLSLVTSVVVSLLLMGSPKSGGTSVFVTWTSSAQHYLGQILPTFNFGPTGLTIASSTAAFVSFLATSLILSKRTPSLKWSPFVRASLRALVASLASASATYWLLGCNVSAFICLLLAGSIYLITYLIVMKVLGALEIKETFSVISRLRRRR